MSTATKPISSNWEALKATMAPSKKNSNKKKNRPGKRDRQSSSSSGATSAKQAKPEIWFDDVDPALIRASMENTDSSKCTKEPKLVKENSTKELTKCLAIDCEMVGAGFSGKTSLLARVSLVNLYGHCVYDKFVAPTEEVTDYRTEFSGIRPENLKNAEDFKIVQKEVYDMIKNRVLVGHAVHHDLKVLFLSHPKSMLRDTSHYFNKYHGFNRPKLRLLAERFLMIKIQEGEHDSVIDAQATMRLYTLFKTHWETKVSKFNNKQKRKPGFKNQPKVTTMLKPRYGVEAEEIKGHASEDEDEDL